MNRLAARLGFASAILLAGVAPCGAQLRLATPDTIEHITFGTGDVEAGCGLRADYAFPDMTLRVEMVGAPAPGGYVFSIKTFSPTSVSPSMRDIWFKTKSFFTLGNFKAGKPNIKGFLESRGVLDVEASRILFVEMATGEVEISLIFDGPLPHSRVPVIFPRPLPEPAKSAFDACRTALTNRAG
ncbi:MAG: hypothetical protein ACKVP4_14325 [Hyphomicrobium sp.]